MFKSLKAGKVCANEKNIWFINNVQTIFTIVVTECSFLYLVHGSISGSTTIL